MPPDPQERVQGSAPRVAVLAMIFTIVLLVASVLCLIILGAYLSSPPDTFPLNEDIVVSDGLTQTDIVEMLEARGVVRSSLYLHLFLRKAHPNDFIKAGSYRFPKPLRAEEVGDALIQGSYMTPAFRITLPEGFRAKDLELYLPEKLHGTTTDEDLELWEGRLFPDTYFISSDATMHEVIALLHSNYENKLGPLRALIDERGMSEAEVITLASLVEREAKDTDSKRMVAKILLNRLKINMLLQVDATFDYILGKESSELTEEDLTIDSPFNTYLYPGLPPAPISNPGLESIFAVLEPADTDYLYYLTGNDGTFHYARSFEEHKRNKERYLR